MMKRWLFLMVLITLFLLLSAFVGAVQSQSAELPPLTEAGPYGVRLQKMTFVDEGRDDWELETFIWYPADKTQGKPFMTGSLILNNAPPDRSGAPYPLIIFSPGWQGASTQLPVVTEYLVSNGYIVAAPQHHDTDPPEGEFVDRPLDILMLLDQLTALTEGDLAGMIDTDNVGLMGWSQGGEAVFQMLGLLRDPVHYTSWCADHPDLGTGDCRFVPLEETSAYRAQLGLTSAPNGAWAPFGDERIHAVLAMAPGDFPLTTEAMLAAVTTPTMILHGTQDEVCDYEGNAVRTYTHLGTEDRYLVTVINSSHDVFYTTQRIPQHFATAFFGYYLQGDETYAPYLTPEGLPAWDYPKLVWGPSEGDQALLTVRSPVPSRRLRSRLVTSATQV